VKASRMPSGAPAAGGYQEYPQDSYREDQRMIDGPPTGPNMAGHLQ